MILEPLDFEILDYVAIHTPISRVNLEIHFQKTIHSISFRIDRLCEPLPNDSYTGISMFDRMCRSDNVLVEHGEFISISDYGRAVLQDYQKLKALQDKKERLDRTIQFITIAISFLALIVSIFAIYKQP